MDNLVYSLVPYVGFSIALKDMFCFKKFTIKWPTASKNTKQTDHLASSITKAADRPIGYDKYNQSLYHNHHCERRNIMAWITS